MKSRASPNFSFVEKQLTAFYRILFQSTSLSKRKSKLKDVVPLTDDIAAWCFNGIIPIGTLIIYLTTFYL